MEWRPSTLRICFSSREPELGKAFYVFVYVFVSYSLSFFPFLLCKDNDKWIRMNFRNTYHNPNSNINWPQTPEHCWLIQQSFPKQLLAFCLFGKICIRNIFSICIFFFNFFSLENTNLAGACLFSKTFDNNVLKNNSNCNLSWSFKIKNKFTKSRTTSVKIVTFGVEIN